MTILASMGLAMLLGAIIIWLTVCAEAAGETLYNGIALPDPWPPKIKRLTRAPMGVPYLNRPPAVIPIDVGRQLFVDDFLIQSTTLTRTNHQPEPYKDNPVLRATRSWERQRPKTGDLFGPYAMAFSDGVWYDPQAPKDRRFKAWYKASHCMYTCHAHSRDGVRWVKPKLDVTPGTNIVHARRRDSSTIWLDHEETNPKRRFKMFWFQPNHGFMLQCSPDGIHWGRVLTRSRCGDRSTAFYNPFRRKWVASVRRNLPHVGRSRAYSEADDAVGAMTWKNVDDLPLWCTADRLDPTHADYGHRPAQLYTLDAAPYESLMLGFFSILQGDAQEDIGRPKRNEVLIGYSRDGFHWHRPLRKPFAGVSDTKGDWNWGNVQSVGGGCLVVGDKLYFYYSGRAGLGRLPRTKSYWDADAGTGLAILRRDGFASMDAGPAGGTLTTRLVTFQGRHLFVNAAAGGGQLRVEVLAGNGRPIAPFTADNCIPVRQDSTSRAVRWKGAADLSAVAGRPVRFRFHLTSGKLYSFWVSPDASGASYGYVAAGGPGFTGPKDTVGTAG